MTEPNTAFAGSIPEFYERHLGTVLFEPYAVDLAARAASLAGPFLELACGTGILTRELLARLPGDAPLTATDLNPPMLAESGRRVPADPRLSWRQADMTALPFEDQSFGAVVCQFGLMFPPDKPAAFREARRVLRPGGTMLFNVWASLADNPANTAAQRALARLFPENPPGFLDVPFGFHDETLIRRLMEHEGFKDIRVEVLGLECRSSTAREFAVGLVRGTPLANDLQARGISPEPVEEALALALAELGGASPFITSMKALVVQAR
ncbi:MAG TPA: methyltransferase domain-containing protein [Holophagaceae bacterium]|jgi:SAM-dependent methyltransferase|nr:methyltransferase domain-containing protein [Holophagaceae bacterium]